jgi:hypothetical protein
MYLKSARETETLLRVEYYSHDYKSFNYGFTPLEIRSVNRG